MTTSGQSFFNLTNEQICSEAFERIELRPTELTTTHWINAQRSLNLLLQSWGNMVPNLWKIDLQSIPLIQGVPTYNIPVDTITILDAYIRTFQLPTTFNVTPLFSTTINSPTINIQISNHGLQTGFWIQLATYVSIGGLVLYGFYQVASVVDANNFTIIAGGNATSTVPSAGQLPQFTTVAGQSVVSVNLPNNGFFAGQQFAIATQTTVGGIVLSGSYTITGVAGANFGIQVTENAQFNDVQYENAGNAQINAQNTTVQPIDIVMNPIGRTDYADQPNKSVQARPTVFWFDRLINPNVTMWQTPDQNGPYVFYYYRMVRIQDASATMGQTADIPFLALEAVCANLAVKLATKYAKAQLPVLMPMAAEALDSFLTENRERCDYFILPQFNTYYNMSN